MNAEKYSPYPKYKDSNDKWLGEVPAPWCVARFKHGIELIESGKRESVDFSDVLSIGGEHIGTDGRLRLENLKYVSRDFYERSKKGRVKEGDTLVVKDGATIGKTAFVDSIPKQLMLLNEHVYRIESTKFFYFYILSKFFQAEIWSKNTSSAQEGLNLSTINNIPTLIPNPEEQKQIASFLDYETGKIDALLEKQQQLIALLGEKRQAVISHAVTKGLNPDAPMRDSGVQWLGQVPKHWERSQPKYFTTKIVDGVHFKPNYVDEGIPFVTVQNLTAGHGISFENLNYVSEVNHKEYFKRANPESGDVLLTKDGATLGVARVIETDRVFSIFVSVALLKPIKELIDPWYLAYLLESVSYTHLTLPTILLV